MSGFMGLEGLTDFIFLKRVGFGVRFEVVVLEMRLKVPGCAPTIHTIHKFIVGGGEVGPIYRVVLYVYESFRYPVITCYNILYSG